MPKMCSAYKEIRKGNPKRYLEMVGDGRYVCKKCGRTAGDRKFLCCPMEIKPGSELPQDELNYCALGKCEAVKAKKKKLKKMSEDELRRVIREEVYATIKQVLEEVKE